MSDHDKIEQMVRLKDQAPLNIDPFKSALLVIDVQRYFARPDYPFGQTIDKLVPGATVGYFERVKTTVLPNIKRLQDAFRAQDLPVIFVGVGTNLEGRDLPA